VYGLLDRSWDQFIAFSQAYDAAGCKITALAAAACKAAAALPTMKPPASPEPLNKVVADLQERLLQLQKEKAAADAENAILQGRVRELKLWNADVRWENMQLQPEVPPQPEASAAAAAEVAEAAETIETPAHNENDKKMTQKQLKAHTKNKRGVFGPGKKQQRNLRFAFVEDGPVTYQ
jgi:hypothetical protein